MSNSEPSPRWNSTAKLTVSLTFLAIIAGLLIKFQSILPQMLLTILLAYLFNPIADYFSRKFKIRWKIAVTLVYILVLLILIGMLTLGGVGLVQQAQNMLDVIKENLNNIPVLFNQISGRAYAVGPFTMDLRKADLGVVGEQFIGSIEPIIGRTGSMVGTVAGGAANLLGWTLFVLLVSYFVLIESDGFWHGILQFNLPGYQHDLEKMGQQLTQIWNAFLRGQLIVMILAASIYTVLLGGMGVNYALGLAFLAGVARFVPYVGPFMLWVILALVSYFQEFKLFGMEPWLYTAIIIGTAWTIDAVVDNILMPRIMASALKVHPAAVLIAAIVGLDLLGILGVILAAPMLATLQLISRYFTRKLFDLDPWLGLEEIPQHTPLRVELGRIVGKIQKNFHFR